MSFERLMRPWSGPLFRHLPAASESDPLDFQFAGAGRTNRWNTPGQPTLCLAGDEGVMIAEWGHHCAINRSPELERRAVERAMFRFEVSLDHVLDLREQAVLDVLQVASPTSMSPGRPPVLSEASPLLRQSWRLRWRFPTIPRGSSWRSFSKSCQPTPDASSTRSLLPMYCAGSELPSSTLRGIAGGGQRLRPDRAHPALRKAVGGTRHSWRWPSNLWLAPSGFTG